MPRKRNEQKEQNENYSKAFPTVMRQLMQTTTQAELAGYLSKTRQSITYYCDGSSSPDWETLVKIADYFDVSTDYLLGRTKEPSRSPSAADEIGLTPKAVSAIKGCSNDPEMISGLCTLLEDRRILGLAGQITQFIRRTEEYTNISKSYKEHTEKTDPEADAEYYKFVLAAQESLIVSAVKENIESQFPKFKGDYALVMGSEMVEYQRRHILDTFDDILRKVSNYNEFRSGILKMEDIWK